MSHIRYTIRRSGTFYYNRRVPTHAVAGYGTHIRQALSSCPVKAKAYATRLSNVLEASWATNRTTTPINISAVVNSFKLKSYLLSEMTAYVLSRKSDLFTRLAAQYRGSRLSELQYTDRDTQAGLSRLCQILDYLIKYGQGRDVLTTKLEGALGFSLRRYTDDLEQNFELMCLSYEYIRGGKSAAFIYKL